MVIFVGRVRCKDLLVCLSCIGMGVSWVGVD